MSSSERHTGIFFQGKIQSVIKCMGWEKREIKEGASQEGTVTAPMKKMPRSSLVASLEMPPTKKAPAHWLELSAIGKF